MKISYGDHEIEIIVFGTRRICYDGTLISSKKFFSGSSHIFSVRENGENVQYEINAGFKWHGLREKISIRRNGRIIYSDNYQEEGLRIDRKTSLTRTHKLLTGLQRAVIAGLLALAVTANYMNMDLITKGRFLVKNPAPRAQGVMVKIQTTSAAEYLLLSLVS